MSKSIITGTILIVIAAAALYFPAISAGYLWDDDTTLTANPTMHSSTGLADIWSKPAESPQSYYWPITYTSLWMEYRLFGDGPSGYHAMNILLHIINAILLWALLSRMGVRGSWMAAMLFLVHPVNVESVAWISERKNTLSVLFTLLTAMLFHHSLATKQLRHLVGTAVLLAIAVLAKTTAATVVPMLVLIHWWKTPSLDKRAALWTAPLILVAGLIAGFQLHVYAQAHPFNTTIAAHERIILGSKCAAFYLSKLIWPHPLMAIYPKWDISAFGGFDWLLPVFWAILLIALFVVRKRIGRGSFVCALSFLFGLAPMLHLLSQAGFSSITYVNDHALYLPMIAICAAVGAGLFKVTARFTGPRKLLLVNIVAFAILIPLAGAANMHARNFKDQITLFTQSYEHNPDNWAVQVGLGTAYLQRGEYELAKKYLELGQQREESSTYALDGLGLISARQGRFDEAIEYFERSLKMNPNNKLAMANIVNTLLDMGDLQAAELVLKGLLSTEVTPDAGLCLVQARILTVRGNWPDAAHWFKATLDYDPRNKRAAFGLATCLHQMGEIHEAVEYYRLAIELDPDNGWAVLELGKCYIVIQRPRLAMNAIRLAGQIAERTGDRELKQEIATLTTAE